MLNPSNKINPTSGSCKTNVVSIQKKQTNKWELQNNVESIKNGQNNVQFLWRLKCIMQIDNEWMAYNFDDTCNFSIVFVQVFMGNVGGSARTFRHMRPGSNIFADRRPHDNDASCLRHATHAAGGAHAAPRQPCKPDAGRSQPRRLVNPC